MPRKEFSFYCSCPGFIFLSEYQDSHIYYFWKCRAIISFNIDSPLFTLFSSLELLLCMYWTLLFFYILLFFLIFHLFKMSVLHSEWLSQISLFLLFFEFWYQRLPEASIAFAFLNHLNKYNPYFKNKLKFSFPLFVTQVF